MSLDVYFMMETLITKGLPLLTSASAVLTHICDRTKYFEGRDSERNYFEVLLSESFYSFWCLKIKDSDPIVCLQCGVIPSCLMGDGNEDISCKVSPASNSLDQHLI